MKLYSFLGRTIALAAGHRLPVWLLSAYCAPFIRSAG
jgi:hypothetical protein